MKPTIYTIAILIAVLAIMWSVTLLKSTSQASPPMPLTEITREMYDAIQTGMALEEVESIMGASAGKSEFSQSPRGQQGRCIWKAHSGHVVYVYTLDSVVTAKGNTFPEPW